MELLGDGSLTNGLLIRGSGVRTPPGVLPNVQVRGYFGGLPLNSLWRAAYMVSNLPWPGSRITWLLLMATPRG